MSRSRFTVLLFAALLAICGAFYLSSQRNLPRDTRGAPLFPALGAELDSVTEVNLIKGAAAPAVTLHKSGAHWTVSQRGDYPADVAKLRRLLLALGDAKVVEEKTSDPANYPIIGVEDPLQAGAGGAEVSVVAKDGKHAVIVGKPVEEGTFVRRAGESRSYVVEPALSVEPEPRAWIETKLLDIPSSSIQKVELKPATGPGYTLQRIKPKQDEFALDKAPAGRKPLDADALAPSATTLSGLTAEDVAAAKDIDFSQASQAIFTLQDGNAITLIGAAVGDKRWIEVQSSKDSALSAQAQNRAFEVASYRYDAIFRPLDQLLAPKESKEPKPAVKASASVKKAGASGRSSPAPAP
ncbi:MAG TPA: DUF4340 domain-containing protein [Steroidobacteraceae bacterium]|nr:DUF4340 domain-containing protein [Steroidobacteraceae bacterium]